MYGILHIIDWRCSFSLNEIFRKTLWYLYYTLHYVTRLYPSVHNKRFKKKALNYTYIGINRKRAHQKAVVSEQYWSGTRHLTGPGCAGALRLWYAYIYTIQIG